MPGEGKGKSKAVVHVPRDELARRKAQSRRDKAKAGKAPPRQAPPPTAKKEKAKPTGSATLVKSIRPGKSQIAMPAGMHPNVRAHVMDPSSGISVPTLLPTGTGFPVTDKIVANYSVSANCFSMFFVTNMPGSTYVISKNENIPLVGGVTAAPSLVTATQSIPTIATSGGPTSIRPMKYSARLEVTTNVFNRGGTVYHGTIPSRIMLPGGVANSAMLQSDWLILSASLRAKPGISNSAIANLIEPLRHVGQIVDERNYNDFTAVDSVNADVFWSRISVGGSTIRERAMDTTYFCVWNDSTNAQTVNITVDAAWYCRFPTDSLLGRMPAPYIPVASAPALQSLYHYTDHANTSVNIGMLPTRNIFTS